MTNPSYILLLFAVFVNFGCNSKKTSETEITNIYQPKFHYIPAKNWVNDPNGLIYLDGEYHLFYQYNPLGDKWGHMSWGHAVSSNLQSWKELPVALPEVNNADSSTTMVFSGSAVVDSLNTSGFFEKGFKKGMVAVYTAHIDKKGRAMGQSQSLAYSSDKGRTWKFYNNNPVLDIKIPDFRDPFVFWYDGKWKMIVAKPLEYTAQIYESKNLKNWNLLSEFGKIGDYAKIWECPSLFKVPVQNTNEFKWVAMISSAHEDKNYVGMQYFVGNFDGKKFLPDPQSEILRIDHGKDFYAAVPFNNRPYSQKYPIIVAWNNNWAYAGELASNTRRGMFSMPRMISLIKKNNQYKMVQKPIFANNIETKNLTINNTEIQKKFEMKSNSYRLTVAVDIKNSKGFKIDLLKNEKEKSIISYDVLSQKLSFDRTSSGEVSFSDKFPSIETMIIEPENGFIKLDIFVDNSIVEIFANDGKAVLSDLVFPKKNKGVVEITIKK